MPTTTNHLIPPCRCAGTLSRFPVLIILLLLSLPALWAQTETARLQGQVLDKVGGAVPGAEVTVTNLAAGRVIAVKTNDVDGGYSIAALTVGRYEIRVSMPGFKAVTREITLQISQVANVNFTLEPGQVSEVIDVKAEAALVDSVTSEVGAIVQGRQIVELPLNGRNFTQLATLVPGVTRGVIDGGPTGAKGSVETYRNAVSGGAALSVNGLRPQANNFILDGLDNNESLVNTIIFFPPAEAIEEFRVQTGVASAEFGRAGGGIVSASIKSGTNEVHGSAFEFLRNSALDARPFFATTKAPLRWNQFGGTLGGPIRRNKLFVFGDYQAFRYNTPLSPDFVTVPTAAFRTGDFAQLLDRSRSGMNPIAVKDLLTGQPFPGNIVPQGRINPVGQKYLNAFPLPNNGSQVTSNYIAQRTIVQTTDNVDIRSDWNMGTRDQMFGRFSYGRDPRTQSSKYANLPAQGNNNYNRQRGVAIGQTHTFSPRLIDELRLGFARLHFAYVPPYNNRNISADLGIPNANRGPLLGGGAAILGGTGLDNTGDEGPYIVPQNTYQAANTTSYNRGAHHFRFGMNIIRRQVNIFRGITAKGQFNFNNTSSGASTGFSPADMLGGFVNAYTIGPLPGMFGTRNWETGYFGQDDWRVSRELTLNLGLRYDFYTWPSEVANRQANFDIVRGALLLAGQGGASASMVHLDKNNFAPRVGFAYNVNGAGATVLRGGYGLFYFLDRGGVSNQLAQNPPFVGSTAFNFDDGYRITLSGRGPNGTGRTGSLDSRLATGPLPSGSYEGFDPANPPARLNVLAVALPSNVNSYVQQWNLQVQRKVMSSTVWSIGYVGTGGKKLASYYNLNIDWFNAPAGTRRFPQWGTIWIQETRGNSIYHSLQTQLERRFSRSLQFRASYTWSHAIDDSTGAFDVTNPQDIRNFALERASSSMDVRHRFVWSSLYELPFGRGRRLGANMPALLDRLVGGWQTNGILVLQSGEPFVVNTGTGAPNNVRPDLVKPVQVFPGNLDRYFSTDSFSRSFIQGGVYVRPGNFGRNVLVGPGFSRLDFSLFKNFRVTERLKIQFRAEFFNLSNTPQFLNPTGNMNSGDFGKIRSTQFSSERQIQLALRLSF